MEKVLEIIKGFEEQAEGLAEAKMQANQILEYLYKSIYGQNGYPPDYLDKMYQESIFELGYLFGRNYQDVPKVFKEAF